MMNCLIKTLLILLSVLRQSCFCVAGDAAGTWKLDDFEDGDLTAAPGLCWIALADDLMGGSSEARHEIRQGGPGGSRHFLGLAAQLSGRSPSFAGAWVPLDRSGRSREFDCA